MFFKTVFFQLKSSTCNTSGFSTRSANELYFPSPSHIHLTKRKIKDRLSSFLPSSTGYSLLPFGPQTEQSTPVALQVEESWRTTFFYNLLCQIFVQLNYMSNSLRFWNAQGREVEPLEIPSLFPLANEERSKTHRKSSGKVCLLL